MTPLFDKDKTVIALTGGVATGKSTVLGIFRKFGADVICSDKIAHELLKKDKNIIKKVVKKFGPGILGRNSQIDRHLLGGIVFNCRQSLRFLEGILHPETKKRIHSLVNESKKELVVVDIPLLFEKRWEKDFSSVVTAYCPKDVQVKRLMERNNLARKEAVKRIQLQMPLWKKKQKSDFAVNTACPKREVTREVRKILTVLQV